MNRCVNKALARGVEAALEDLPRSGRPREISDEAIAWVIGVACTKPVELGYASELWTYTKLVQHISQHAPEAGYPETAARDSKWGARDFEPARGAPPQGALVSGAARSRI